MFDSKHIFTLFFFLSDKNLTNRCYRKPDAIYPIRDVFKYLECKDGKEIIHNCTDQMFHDPADGKCRTSKSGDLGKLQDKKRVVSRPEECLI